MRRGKGLPELAPASPTPLISIGRAAAAQRRREQRKRFLIPEAATHARRSRRPPPAAAQLGTRRPQGRELSHTPLARPCSFVLPVRAY